MYDAIISLFPPDYVVHNPAIIESAVCVCGVVCVVVLSKVVMRIFNL